MLIANIAPALVAKVVWPYFVPGRVRYTKRVNFCSFIACLSVLTVAYFPSLVIRLSAIGSASFISGLGEMTFLQLSTTYAGGAGRGARAVAYFASGTGAAGLVGALLWWLVRGLGVLIGLSLAAVGSWIVFQIADSPSLQVIPLGMAATYHFLLPLPDVFERSRDLYISITDDENVLDTPSVTDASEYVEPLAKVERERVRLTTAERFRLAKPLVLPYMIPLFFVYMGEYSSF